MVVDTRTSKLYCVANGGHGDYAGNEVDVLALNVASPAWAELLAPSSSAQYTAPPSDPYGNVQYYLDGRPCARHTYYGVTLNIPDDRIMLCGGVGWGNNGIFMDLAAYNIGGNSYDGDIYPAIPDPLASDDAVVCADGSTGDIYYMRSFIPDNAALKKWTRSTGLWGNAGVSGSGPTGHSQMTAYDSSRGKIFHLGGDDAHHTYNIGANTWSSVTLTGAEAATVQALAQQGMIYVPDLDKYFVRSEAAGGTVYQIDAATFDATQFSTTGGGSIPVVDGTNHVYNKFLYVPALKGAVYVPAYASAAWFLRLH